MAVKKLSPKLDLKPAEKELEIIPGQEMLGNRQGGLYFFSNTFKRGYGDDVFGSDENGIWLGAAEFTDAPFRVFMNGNAIFRGAGEGTAGIFINAEDKTIIINDGENDRVLIGYDPGGF